MNKSFLRLLITLIIPVSGCNLGGDNSFNTKKKKQEPQVSDQVLEGIREGDILLRKGRGPFSEKIVEFLDEDNRFSHAGMVVEINGTLTIVHSISEDMSGHDGVQTQSIREFANDIADSTFCIVRPKISDDQLREMVRIANYYLEKKIPFDYDYITDDSTRLYCSEFLYYTTGNATGKEIFNFKEKGLVKIVLFNSFLNEEYFEIIYCLKPLK